MTVNTLLFTVLGDLLFSRDVRQQGRGRDVRHRGSDFVLGARQWVASETHPSRPGTSLP